MGPERLWHFFHYEGEEERPCKKRGDTKAHESLQQQMMELLLEQDTAWVKEFPIPEARRVADLALPKNKIALEIQRSALSLDSLLQRTEAYWKNGWSVAWFLPLSLFRTSVLPKKLQQVGVVPHYFFEEDSSMVLWDLLLINKARQTHRKIPTLHVQKRDTTHSFLPQRDGWAVHLKGDFLDRPPEENIHQETRSKQLKQRLSLLWLRLIGT